MAAFMSEFEHLRIPLEIIKSATNNFGDHNFIAEGGYGKVYRGEFLRAEGKTMGAVKRWNPLNEEGDPEFRREIMLLSDNTHENLILLLGFCYEKEERILVYEFASNKSLDFHLQDPNLTWTQRLDICVGAARGLEYLHNPKGTQRVLHCDIKSANILLDENWKAKIADFGLSKYGPANQNRSYLITQAKGTYGYCDPVFSETMIYTKESDVYSFGVVLFEVLCSRLCFDFSYDDKRRSLPLLVKNSSKEQIRDTIVEVNLRQQMAENSFDTFVTLAHQCLGSEQKQRPPMDFIVRGLETALEYQILADKEKRDLVAGEEPEERNIVFQALGENPDDDIDRWSRGKEGNLHALLSTLHHILVPESGWKPVWLTETTSTPTVVRGHFDRAVSIIHPRKLKKRGASIKEEYISSKVFEILKVGFERDQLRILGEYHDDAIKSWSSGKEGDLRALISTLDEILEPGIGWEPVLLAETSSASDVREYYEMVVFLLRPSKLKKEGATIDEKYIYGKVVEILKVGLENLESDERVTRTGKGRRGTRRQRRSKQT